MTLDGYTKPFQNGKKPRQVTSNTIKIPVLLHMCSSECSWYTPLAFVTIKS